VSEEYEQYFTKNQKSKAQIILAKEASKVLGGRGSGRPDFAQGGGTQTEKLPEALKKAQETTKQAKETRE
jgi:alanyl-tRNA synthetase